MERRKTERRETVEEWLDRVAGAPKISSSESTHQSLWRILGVCKNSEFPSDFAEGQNGEKTSKED
jgi:hypothetical protein